VKAVAALVLAAVALMPATAHARPLDVVCDATGNACTDSCEWLNTTTGHPKLCRDSGNDVCVGFDSSDAPVACAPVGDDAQISIGDIEQIILTGPHHLP
jgi:hypothetical protein